MHRLITGEVLFEEYIFNKLSAYFVHPFIQPHVFGLRGGRF